MGDDITDLVVRPAVGIRPGDPGEPVQEVVGEGLVVRGDGVIAAAQVAAGVPGMDNVLESRAARLRQGPDLPELP
jgi:hypothetical protein